MRILVAEDDPGLRNVLVLGLEDQGYQVDSVERGDDAIDQLKFYDYEVAILDWRMPGAEGIEVVRWARRQAKPTALLMLTARDAPPDRVTGLDAGADDYLVKPFATEELLARVRSLLRRGRSAGDLLSAGDVTLDLQERAGSRRGRDLELTPREADLLELLLRNTRSVVSREQALQHVWGEGDVTLNTVDRYVAYLRRKLGEPPLIRTVRGVGFVLDP